MRCIWLAAGLALYRIDVDTAFNGGDPTPVLPPEDLGYLRSVFVTGNGTDATVLVGAQGGVLVYRPQGSTWTVYRYRPAPRGRGGANSVTLCGGQLLATHSEMGLHQWFNASCTVSSLLFPDKIVPGRSTRGIQQGPDGKVYFSHVGEVYCFDPRQPEALIFCGRLPQSVTALCVSGDKMLAGSRDGRLYRWREPEEWQELSFRSQGPIFQITRLGGGEECGWVVGARETAVHVLDCDGDLVTEYRSRYPIRWVSGGRQGVLGVDRFGQHLLLWQWKELRFPARRIRVPDQIQYLAVEREGT